ncbi:MAG: OsmC family protein [Capsulimonadaceae bacterium]
MAIRKAQAEWKGDLFSGAGSMSLGSGAYSGAYTFKSRMEDGVGTNPEELIAAAHAGCYSMALTAMLAGAGHTPESVRTQALVHFDKVDGGFAITRIQLETVATVPGLDPTAFAEFANKAKTGCPVSKALAATEIVLNASLA